ncbi:DUF4174 domain-containing protein [Rhodobacteraceae bacterium NNCM2]|nr:DUF4174 domain-containing protein [Coraliihabitans acroporae]
MKLAAPIATLLAALPLTAEADLGAHLWESRPILVFSEPSDPRLAEQIDLFEAHRPELDERRNVVIVETDPRSPLWRRFAPEGFAVILIGLDGGEKFRGGEVTDPATLSALIDTMAMRRNELRRKNRD